MWIRTALSRLVSAHGWRQNEFGWDVQIRANSIVDHLLAESNTKPFIIVMTYMCVRETINEKRRV